MNIAVCGLVRNAEKNLRLNLERLDSIRSNFTKLRVIVFENDSTDDTKNILQDYQKQHEDVFISCENFNENPFQNGPFSLHRIRLLSKYRNAYLDKLKEFKDTDFVLVLDFDIFSFDVEALKNTLKNQDEWHMRSAFGINYVKYKLLPVFYDIYAYMEVQNGSVLRHCFEDFDEYKTQQRNLFIAVKKTKDLIPVISNFNGLAVYPYKVITCGARYHEEPCDFMGIESFCEHAIFHKQLIERGFDKLFIDPTLRVIYEKPTYLYHLKEFAFYVLDRKLRYTFDKVRRTTSKLNPIKGIKNG